MSGVTNTLESGLHVKCDFTKALGAIFRCVPFALRFGSFHKPVYTVEYSIPYKVKVYGQGGNPTSGKCHLELLGWPGPPGAWGSGFQFSILYLACGIQGLGFGV